MLRTYAFPRAARRLLRPGPSGFAPIVEDFEKAFGAVDFSGHADLADRLPSNLARRPATLDDVPE